MNRDDILALRECEDKDKSLDLIKGAITAMEDELAPVFSLLEQRNKPAYLDLLIYRLDTLNELLAQSVKILTNKFTQESTFEQALIEGNLMASIK